MTRRLLSRTVTTVILASALLACGLTVVGTKPDPDDPGPPEGSVAVLPGADRDANGGDGEVDAAPDGEIDDDAAAADASLDADADGAADAASDADADAGPTTTVGATSVDVTSLTVDLVSPGDGAIASDGQVDGVFRVVLTGPVVALTLIRTDAGGAPAGGQQWDTWVGADPIPALLGSSFVAGSSTFQLGVFDTAGTLLNDAAGRLTLTAGPHTLLLAGADVGSFVAGAHFRVVAERPDGALVRGPVLTY